MSRSALAPPTAEIEQQIVDTVRTLSLDAVQKANSGHPGMPMGGADFATVLWTRHLRIDPEWPQWPGRDRFVLSAGHGSMLLYSMLHLAGFDLPMEELERFRQWGSKTPGHPEYGHTAGVETTTGPLGQGLGNAVGMALAERLLAARYPNQPDGAAGHRTFCFASDGDLMEGVASEVSSLAGQWGLGNLCVWWDANEITIDGSTDLSFREDVAARYRAYGWHVAGPVDGHERDAIDGALRECLADATRPSLIVGRTKIAHGSPSFEGTSRSHGAPLGEEEIAAVKEVLGLDPSRRFFVPDAVRAWFAEWRGARGQESAAWRERRERYRETHADEARAWEAALSGEIAGEILADPPTWETGQGVPTRKAGHQVLQVVAQEVPDLVTGSADLLESNLTGISGSEAIRAGEYAGRTLYFGIREHGMGAIVNGLVLHGGVRAVGSTFLVFSDYMRPPIRLAGLMGIPAVHVFTHDTVHLGEDGPTHQPIEHLDALRAIPNVHVVRPADARETVAAWRHAIRRQDGPTLIVLTRQALPVLDRAEDADVGGAGVVRSAAEASVSLVASGSEVSLCCEAADRLSSSGVEARVVSVPCLESFGAAEPGAQEQLLGRPPRLFVEAATGYTWAPWMRGGDAFLGIRRFGASAPGPEVAARLGMNPEEVARCAAELLG